MSSPIKQLSVLFYIHITNDLVLNGETVKHVVINSIKTRAEAFFSAKYQVFFAAGSESALNSSPACSLQYSEFQYIVSLDCCNPLFDEQFVDYHLGVLDRASNCEQSPAYFDGNPDQMLPGTAVEYIARLPIKDSASPCDNKSNYLPSCLHRKYVTNISIKRKKSLKVFIGLLQNGDFPRLALRDILAYFETSAGVRDVIRYGSEAQLAEQILCPVCKSPRSSFVHTSVGYPRVGFLHNFSDYYKRCQDCSHVFLSYYPESPAECDNYYDLADSELSYKPATVDGLKSESQLETSSYYDNFLLSRNYLIDSILPETSARKLSLLDIGAGQGDFLLLMKYSEASSSLALAGFDLKISPKVASAFSELDINLFSGEIESYLASARNDNVRFDVVTLFEVIEHIHPHLLARLPSLVAKILNPGGKIILSTPDFQALGARLTDFWAAYAPQHYSVFTYSSLTKLFSEYFTASNCEYRSYPFKDLATELDYYKDFHSSRSRPALNAWFDLLTEEVGLMSEPDRWAKFPCEMIVVLDRIE